MYFEFKDDDGQIKLCKLSFIKSIITLIMGRNVAKHVPRKNIYFD